VDTARMGRPAGPPPAPTGRESLDPFARPRRAALAVAAHVEMQMIGGPACPLRANPASLAS
jgi:hypothetical protein